jgi:hypothetical protein
MLDEQIVSDAIAAYHAQCALIVAEAERRVARRLS